MADPKFFVPDEMKQIIKALLGQYGGMIGAPRPGYQGALRAGISPASQMAQAIAMQRMRSGGPAAWQKAGSFSDRYRGGGPGRNMPGGMPAGGFPPMGGFDPRMFMGMGQGGPPMGGGGMPRGGGGNYNRDMGGGSGGFYGGGGY